MRRREFIALVSGSAALTMAARAQHPGRVRRIGVLMGAGENDPAGKAELLAFARGLAELGWTDSRNLQMDVRWTAGNLDQMRMFAKELVDLQPDVILVHSTPVTAALQRQTRTIPTVFVLVGDPIGDGFVASLASPGGNITGFLPQEAAITGKWLELLTEIAPGRPLASRRVPSTGSTATSTSGGIPLPTFSPM